MSLIRPRRDRMLAATLGALLLALLLAGGALAMPAETPDRTWAVNGRVSASVQVGNVVYVGGSFTEVRENGGAGPGTLPRSNLAAFNATTGAPTGWAPSANAEVFALAASPDGARIYAGGKFTSISALSRSRVAAITAATGSVESWRAPSFNSSVLALAVSGSRLYVGGTFGSVAGAPQSRLVALSTTSAAVDSGWVPTADSTVRTIAVSPDGSRVYAGGDFTLVNGIARPNAVALSSAGVVDPAWNPGPGEKVFGLVAAGSSVYAAIGGGDNDVERWDATSGSVRWSRHSDGDFQAIALAGSVVYAGGHFNYFEGELRRKLVALDAATGALRRAWRPRFPSGAEFWGGVWSLSTFGTGRLAVGGDFDGISGVRQDYHAQFTGSLTGPANDTSAPSTPSGLDATVLGGKRVDLTWTASQDNDAVAFYRVYRNGSQIDTSETSVFSDTSVSSSKSYSYHVVAVDFSGNASAASNTDAATTPASNDARTFVATEDAYIASASPTTNYGSSSSLNVGLSPRTDVLLKFNLSGLAGRQILSAKLRLHNTEGSTVGGEFSRVASNSWSESSVTWANAPSADPAVLDKLDDVAPGNWYEADVTEAVAGDGTLSIRSLSSSSDPASFYSSEGSSSRAPQLVVTLAAAGTATSAAAVFKDGFETGDLSRWFDYEGLAVRSGEASSGSWSARAKSTGQATFAYTSLPVSEPELYTKFRFKLHSNPSLNVTLLRLLTGSGLGLTRLYVTPTGQLVTSNSISDVAKATATPVTTGVWHSAQLRAVADGANSRLELWLDDVKIDSVTHRDSLGTAPIGRIQLGNEGTGKTYDIGYDDLVSDTEPIPSSAPPSAPTGLAATAPRIGEVALSWRAATDDVGVTGYEVYRDGALLTTTSAVTSFVDAGVSPSTSYEYRLRAKDADGNTSPYSAPASVTALGPDTTAPTTPGNLAAAAVSYDRVDLSWQPSTDAVGVTGYRVYRDSGLIDTIPATSPRYRDTGVTPSRSYRYAVEALDAAGNVSPAGAEAAATTPNRTVFRDGFETGDFGQWTKASGLIVEQGSPLVGSWAARAKTTSSARYAYKTLPATYRDLSYEVRFKALSQGSSSTVSLLKLKTASGTSLMRLHLSTSGKLGTRNDVTGVTSTSFASIIKGWTYTARVRLRINGAASRIDVSLDGMPVGELSKTDSFGTTPIGRVQLGEDSFGKSYDITYDEVVVDAPPASIAAPTVSGTARDGETLSADPGSWSGTEPVSHAYQWQRCAAGGACTDIAGAAERTYTLRSQDVGSSVRVVVTAANAAGAAALASSATQTVAPAPPAGILAPTLSGTPRDGETLSADPGSWSGTEPISYAYQWRRCDAAGEGCADIADATDPSFTLSAADVGSTIRVQVTASNAGGQSSASSAASGAVDAVAPANDVVPAISGEAQDGQALTADRGSWSGTEPISYAYQWRRCDAAGEGCADIADATDPSFTLSAADVGSTIRVRVTASNAGGQSSTSSAASAPVVGVAPDNSGTPSISGTAGYGETLTVDPGSWSGTEPISYAYQWRRCDAAGEGCADIAGATDQDYTLTAADIASTVRVTVTASNPIGSASATSEPSDLVAAALPVNSIAPTISGSAQDGEALSADHGSWSGTEPISYAYRWRRCDAAGEGCADIAGAVDQSYTLSAADVGFTVRIAVTATNPAGSSAATSDRTETVVAPPPADPEAGLALAWSDEFEGAAGSPPDASSWTHQTGGQWSNGAELQCHTTSPDNSSHDGQGNLQIVARSETVACGSSTNDYTSARINTKGKREFQYGYIEARIKAPAGQGVWPAFLTLGADSDTVGWPATGSMDIFEAIGSEPSTVHQTIHGPTASGDHWQLPTPTGGTAWSEDFHDYGVKWVEDRITFYLDGVATRTLTPGDLQPEWQWALNKPSYLLLNIAVGGPWPGNPDATTPWPATMLVDYMRVYQ